MQYNGYVHAKVGTKSNSYRESHIDAHYLFARNKMRRELGSLFSTNINVLSVDDMSKIKVGAPAVSRYHQIKRFFPDSDGHNHKDHDFPYPGYLLNVSGHMFLEQKNSEVPAEHNGLLQSTCYDPPGPTVEPIFESMFTEDLKANNIFSIICRQAYLHLNVALNPTDCKSIIISEIKENIDRYKPDTVNESHFLEQFEEELNSESGFTLLKAPSAIFRCKIILFRKINNTSYPDNVIIEGFSKSFESPLYILQDTDDKQISWYSLAFKRETCKNYENILSNYKGKLVYDNIGRVHLPTPYSGSVNLSLRSNKYHHSTIATHVADLFYILKDSSKSSAMLLADGGPDFTPMSVVNMLFFYRLFKKLNLDFLSISTYAARYSAFNPIEHAWSPLSNKLAGVIFDPKLEFDAKSPCQQSDLSNYQLKEKEFAVFDQTLNDLSLYWKNSPFDGFTISIKKINCGEDKLLWDDYNKVKEFFKAPVRELHTFSSLIDECMTMFQHVDRHLNELCFMRCNDKSCCSVWRSNSLKEYFGNFDFQLFAPIFSTCRSGHFDTFLQCNVAATHVYGDAYQPTAVKNDLGKCDFCPSYCFKSKTERGTCPCFIGDKKKVTGNQHLTVSYVVKFSVQLQA